MAKHIIPLFPPHKIYVEPFGGGAGILLQKKPAHTDVYNDLDGDIVNMFKMVRENPDLLAHMIDWTPFSRDEFYAACEKTEDPLEQARRTIVRAFMGFGSAAATKGSTGFRGLDAGSHSYKRWDRQPQTILDAAKRLKKCVIENKHYNDIFTQYDTTETLFYLDPPYVKSTRTSITSTSGVRYYNHEMEDKDHIDLINRAKSLNGMVVISGYASDLYDHALSDWGRYTFASRAAGHRGTVNREEVVWIKPNNYKTHLFN